MPSTTSAWTSWLVLSMFYAYQFIQRILPNIIMDDIMTKYHVNANEMSHFAGIYYVGYVIAHIPIGMMLDRFNAKKIIPLCILVTVFGLSPLRYVDDFRIVGLGRLFVGMGSSAATVGAFQLIRLGFGEKKFPKMLGWMVTIGLVGAVFGSGPLTKLISHLGWRQTLDCLLILGLLLFVLSYFSIPNTNSDTRSNVINIIEDFKTLLKNRTIFVICIIGGFMIGPLEGFADAWSNPYLKTVFKLNNEQSSNVTQLVYIGMAIGLFIMGTVFEKTKSYYSLLTTSAISMLVCLLVLTKDHTYSIVTLEILFFTIGLFCSYQVLIIAKVVDLVEPNRATFISAVANMIMMGFGYFSHRSIGIVLHYFWDGSRNKLGIPVYSIKSFNQSIYVLILALMCAVIGLATLYIIEKKDSKKTL